MMKKQDHVATVVIGMAGATVVTRLMADGGSASAFCITAALIGSSHQSGRQKNRNKIIRAKSSGAK